MSVGLRVWVCVCERVRACACEVEVSDLLLLKSTSMLKRDWVMTQGFLKSVSIQHVACQKSWKSYNKHLFVSILCVVRPKPVGLVFCTAISPHGTTVRNRLPSHLLTVCARFCPIDTIQCDAFFSRDRVNFKSGTCSAFNSIQQVYKCTKSVQPTLLSPFLKLVSRIDYFTTWSISCIKSSRLERQNIWIHPR